LTAAGNSQVILKQRAARVDPRPLAGLAVQLVRAERAVRLDPVVRREHLVVLLERPAAPVERAALAAAVAAGVVAYSESEEEQ